MVLWVFMAFTVNLNRDPFNFRRIASSLAIQEWLQAFSRRSSAPVLTFEGLSRSTSRTRRNHFVEFNLVACGNYRTFYYLREKRVLTHELLFRQPSYGHFCWCGHVRNECSPFKHEKSWFSPAILARCVAVFSLKDWHCQMWCRHLHSTHVNSSFLALSDVFLDMLFALPLAAKDYWGNVCFCCTYVTVILNFALQRECFHAPMRFCFLIQPNTKL